MNLLSLQILSDVGIAIEIIGFILGLLFWRAPKYSDLYKWKKIQKLYKFIFGEEKYRLRLLDDTVMDDDDTITKTTGLALEEDNKVPKQFLHFWKYMRRLSFIVVIIGLFFQFSFLTFWII